MAPLHGVQKERNTKKSGKQKHENKEKKEKQNPKEKQRGTHKNRREDKGNGVSLDKRVAVMCVCVFFFVKREKEDPERRGEAFRLRSAPCGRRGNGGNDTTNKVHREPWQRDDARGGGSPAERVTSGP